MGCLAQIKLSFQVSRIFGLIGFPLGHSWSKKYFTKKFRTQNIKNARYELFPLHQAADLDKLLRLHPQIVGLNVTIPYKSTVISSLTRLDSVASAVGAVNVIKVKRDGGFIETIGYNTDVTGFEQSIKPLLRSHHKAAMILGTGGAARAAAWVFDKLGIDYVFVSRNPDGDQQIGYDALTDDIFEQTTIIVNATPLGMKPDIDKKPQIPYDFIGSHHLLFDMIYNPLTTAFLKHGLMQGATVKNGLEMLHIQAEESWKIWNAE